MCGEPIVTLSRQRLKRKCIILRGMDLYLQAAEELFCREKKAGLATPGQAGEQAQEGAEYIAASSNARNPQQVPTVLEPLQQGAALETSAIFGFADAQATGQQQSRRDYPRLWRGPAA